MPSAAKTLLFASSLLMPEYDGTHAAEIDKYFKTLFGRIITLYGLIWPLQPCIMPPFPTRPVGVGATAMYSGSSMRPSSIRRAGSSSVRMASEVTVPDLLKQTEKLKLLSTVSHLILYGGSLVLKVVLELEY